MGNFLVRKPTESIPEINKYEILGLLRNPFPVDPAVKPYSSDERENGSIFYTDLREKEINRFKEIVIGQDDKINLLMDYAAYSGRGIGKTAYLNYIKRQINSDLGESFSSNTQVLYAIYVCPGGEKRERKFWQIAKLIYDAILHEDLFLVIFCRLRALTGLIPDEIFEDVNPQNLETTLANDSWLHSKGVNVENLNAAVAAMTRSVSLGDYSIQIDFFTYLGSNSNSYQLFMRRFTPEQSELFWRKGGVEFVFNTLVKLLKIAEFSHCFILFDEAEKIITAQNPAERRELCENLRYYFIDGSSENTNHSFFKILLTIHPNSQELLLPHWQSAGLDRFTEIGGEAADKHTIFFHPLENEEVAVALATEYIKHACSTQSDSIAPFTKRAIIKALKRSDGIPGKFLKMLYYSIEKAITDGWKIIDVDQIDNVWNTSNMVSHKKKEDFHSLLPSRTDLLE